VELAILALAGYLTAALPHADGTERMVALGFLRAGAPVQGLFAPGGPATVPGLVVPVVVRVSVEGVRWRRPTAHVSQEVLEGVAPARADRDAAASVAGPLARVRVRTALSHAGPDSVFGRPFLTMASLSVIWPSPVLFPNLWRRGDVPWSAALPAYEPSDRLFLKASAGTGVAVAQLLRFSRDEEAAIAFAHYARPVVRGSRTFGTHYHQAPETLPDGDGFQSAPWHGVHRTSAQAMAGPIGGS